MSLMDPRRSLIPHLVKKDIRAARAVWLVWIGVALLDVIWQAIGAGLVFEATMSSSPVHAFRGLLPLVQLAVMLALVSQVVHEDPLVDANAFWLTRPIPPARLFLAKLFALLLLVLAPPLLMQAALLVWFQVPPVYVLRIGLEVCLGIVPLLLVGFAAASATASPVRFALLLAGALATVMLTWSMLMSLWLSR